MEEDPEEDPNIYDPRDGGVMYMGDEPNPTVDDARSEYESIGFDEGEGSNQPEQ